MNKKGEPAQKKAESMPIEPEDRNEKQAAESAPGAREEISGESRKELKEEIEKLQLQMQEQNEKYIRLLAEYDNFRKRSQKEREALFPEAFVSCAVSFLPVLDNLERAANEETADANYKKGIEMIRKQFYDVLQKVGITEIEAQGAPFDPELHNAVQHIEDENLGENVVAEVLQKGFIMGEKVVRHAIVKVAN